MGSCWPNARKQRAKLSKELGIFLNIHFSATPCGPLGAEHNPKFQSFSIIKMLITQQTKSRLCSELFVLASTRTLYENKLLELMNSSPQTPRGQTNETEDLDRYSEMKEEKTKGTILSFVGADIKIMRVFQTWARGIFTSVGQTGFYTGI